MKEFMLRHLRLALVSGGAIISLLLEPAMSPAASAATVVNLRCEYLVNPLGIDSPKPTLTWEMKSEQRGEMQTAYRVLVASSIENLQSGKPDFWDTGKTECSEESHLACRAQYAGPALASGTRYYWTVRAWDKDGKETALAPPAWWETGLLSEGDRRGNWIGSSLAPETTATPAVDRPYSTAPLLRHTFSLKSKPVRARAYVSGLAYYDMSLNGRRVGDHMLDPGYTRFDKTALYVTHDVTDHLKAGRNAVGVVLGTGWYDVHTLSEWNFDKAPWRDAPKLLLDLRIDYADGTSETIASGANWKCSTGPTTFDSIYEGEAYDARLEKAKWDTAAYDDSDWQPVRIVRPPGGKLVAQQMPPIRITDRIKPKKVSEPEPGVFVFDLGQNIAGVPELSVKGVAGTTVSMKCGERITTTGLVDQEFIAGFTLKRNPDNKFQTDTYTIKGSGREKWHPRFTYHGFQYVEVRGFPGKPTLNNLAGLVMHTDLQPVGKFECSNPLFNRIVECARWAYLGNFHSIPTDCPTREKNGWTGDAHLAADQGMYTFDGVAAYRKWFNDIADAQQPDGSLPGIIPSGGWGYTRDIGPAWDSVCILLPWSVYRFYGDPEVLSANYGTMTRYVDYLTSNAEAGLIKFGLGDWAPYEANTPNALTSTGYYYRDCELLAQIAKILGKQDDATRYAQTARQVSEAFNSNFLDTAKGVYANGTQTAQSCPLYQGLVPPDKKNLVFDNLLKAVEARDYHIDTGILGAKYLLNVLSDHARSDVAYRIASQKTLPSWGWWIEQGATTLWEQWKGTDSLNHIMFGDIVAWFYRVIAGIDQAPDSAGFSRIVIRPHIVGDLTFARAEYNSVNGKIVSDWKREGNKLRMNVTIPPNTTAEVHVPARDAKSPKQDGKQLAADAVAKSGKDAVIIKVGSGTYRFESEL